MFFMHVVDISHVQFNLSGLRTTIQTTVKTLVVRRAREYDRIAHFREVVNPSSDQIRKSKRRRLLRRERRKPGVHSNHLSMNYNYQSFFTSKKLRALEFLHQEALTNYISCC